MQSGLLQQIQTSLALRHVLLAEESSSAPEVPLRIHIPPPHSKSSTEPSCIIRSVSNSSFDPPSLSGSPSVGGSFYLGQSVTSGTDFTNSSLTRAHLLSRCLLPTIDLNVSGGNPTQLRNQRDWPSSSSVARDVSLLLGESPALGAADVAGPVRHTDCPPFPASTTSIAVGESSSGPACRDDSRGEECEHSRQLFCGDEYT